MLKVAQKLNQVIYIFIIFMFIVQSGFGQGGWARQKGSYFTKLDFTTFSSNDYRTPSGLALETSKFNQKAVNFYGEYGVSDKLGLVVAMPLLRANAFETTNTMFGPGDLRIDVKYNPFRIREYVFPLSFAIGAEIPTGRRNAFASAKDNPLESINLPTGDGEFNFWATTALSIPIGRKLYASSFFAYNKRTTYDSKQFKDLYQVGFELGVNPIKNLWLNSKLRSQFTTGDSQFPELGFVRGDATSFTVISGELFYRFTDKWGVSVTYFSGNDWLGKAKNLYLGSYFSVGVTYEIPYDFEKNK